jgi:hypothetical protein
MEPTSDKYAMNDITLQQCYLEGGPMVYSVAEMSSGLDAGCHWCSWGEMERVKHLQGIFAFRDVLRAPVLQSKP